MYKLKSSRFIAAFPAVLLAASLPFAAAQSEWQVAKTFHVGGDGGWDYLT
jgi:hypothetical protein